ncbi:hypothetical protein SDC9_108772 [bioreactor metagenome]|uniref:YbhB/YbcL family Raf kinase inhibitor-like protein n=1 Tax=bioreactor metagenome TaxID=1076179 RepID=A0A645BA41_9ZZZZ|nr:YbhB/YbcL family Raf kinase inhibitor-like protein [Christensenella sp.]
MKAFFAVLAMVFSLALLLACQAQTPPAQSPVAAAIETPVPTGIPVPAASVNPVVESPAPPAPGNFSISSSGIVNGVLADQFGERGMQKENGIPTRSFALSVQNLPDGTACLTLSVTDPDGGDWVHWLAANLPAGDLPENASIDLAANIVQGKNDFGFVGYGGPTPPSGTHTYVITVYALREPLSIDNGFSQKQFEQAMHQKILASATLTADYTH